MQFNKKLDRNMKNLSEERNIGPCFYDPGSLYYSAHWYYFLISFEPCLLFKLHP